MAFIAASSGLLLPRVHILRQPLWQPPVVSTWRHAHVLCSEEEGEEDDLDWDRAWRRYQLEAADEGGTNVLQDALSDLVQAEASVRSAQQMRDEAAEEKAKLQAELAAVQREMEQLPDAGAVELAGRVTLALALAYLLQRLQSGGVSSALACLLLPLGCATGQV